MAESGLSIGFPELKSEVGFYVGYGRTVANFSAAEDTEVETLVQSGIRRVYYPIALPQGMAGYEWTWLRPSSTLYLGASGIDGAVSTLQFDSASYTDWTAYGITAAIDTVTISAGTGPTLGTYDIDVVAVGDLTLSAAPGDGTSLTFYVGRNPANYTLPDNFGRIIGSFQHAADEHRSPIMVISESAILEMRAHTDLTGVPVYAAVRPKSSTGATGQRWEVIFWPRPDTSFVLTYSYEAYSGALTDLLPYPLGGMQLSELYIESCLSVAEQRLNNELGLHTQAYQSLILDAIARDMKRGAQNFGFMGHIEDPDERIRIRRGLTGVTYKGEAV